MNLSGQRFGKSTFIKAGPEVGNSAYQQVFIDDKLLLFGTNKDGDGVFITYNANIVSQIQKQGQSEAELPRRWISTHR